MTYSLPVIDDRPWGFMHGEPNRVWTLGDFHDFEFLMNPDLFLAYKPDWCIMYQLYGGDLRTMTGWIDLFDAHFEVGDNPYITLRLENA